MKTILLTGCAGFIGSRTAELLLMSGKTVVGLDNLNDYYDVRLKNYRLKELKKSPKFTFIKADVSELKTLVPVFKKFQFSAVIHLAGMAGVRYSMENPEIYLKTNALGTLNILELMKRYKVKKLVTASTSSLYAGQRMPFKEDLPVNTPISPYAASKKSAEVMAYTYHYLYDLNIAVLRYFTVYGPAGRPDMSVFRFIKWIDEGQPIQLYGDGKQSRDFTFIDDIARGTIRALNVDGYKIINLGGGHKPVSINYLIKTIERYLGKKAIIKHLAANKSDMETTRANIIRARRVLGWQPEVSFEEGVQRTVDWYLANQTWLKDIKV